MIKYKVEKVCFEPWAEKVMSCWEFIGKEQCFVLLGESKVDEKEAQVVLITRNDIRSKKKVYGLLFSKPLKLPSERNLLWHEMGHVKGKKSKNKVLSEFYADKWAIETAWERGFVTVVEEILLRCVEFCIDKSADPSYKEAADKIIKHFQQYCKQIVQKYSH